MDRTWEEGEETAASERNEEVEWEVRRARRRRRKRARRSTCASEDPARTHRRGRFVESSQLTDCRPDTILVRRRPVPVCLRTDWLRFGLLSGPSRSANGTAAAKPFTHTRSRSRKSRWEKVERTPTENIAHRTSLFP